jgi:hypothetical protein
MPVPTHPHGAVEALGHVTDCQVCAPTCTHCGTTVTVEGNSLVDTVNGDDGGTYDYCPYSPTRQHALAVLRVKCSDCGLGGHRDVDGVYHGDRDVEPCPRGDSDFHNWTASCP